jgi:hypothetical protein
MTGPVDGHQSLEQIEGDDWGDPPDDATALIRTVHALRRKPVGELSTEDLRELIPQRVGLAVVVPLALRHLRDDPLLEAAFYPGDLLSAVLAVPSEFWSARPDLLATARAVVDGITEPGDDLGRDIAAFRRRSGP